MPVEKDDRGHRSIRVEVEVPGTPEQVWQAIATGPGITSWFVPTEFETDENGAPVRVVADFGPGMESVSTITAWQPPHRFAADSADLGPDAPTIATEWVVEARDGNTCTVRVVHSLFADSDDWDAQLEGWESGWPAFFRILRLYLAHFAGEDSALMQLQAWSTQTTAEAWSHLRTGLGLASASASDRCTTADDAPPMSAWVEHDAAQHGEELLLRLDEPCAGIAHLFAMSMAEKTLLSVRIMFYGDGAAGAARAQEPRWQQWLAQRFPAPE